MTQRLKDSLLSAAVALICVLVLDKYGIPLEASEFRGGWLTGVLLDLYNAGLTLFVVGLFLTFLWRRVAAVTGLVASLLCLPVFLYGIFPGVFRRIFPGEYKVPLLPGFVPSKWTLVGMLVIAIVIAVNIRSLVSRTQTAGS